MNPQAFRYLTEPNTVPKDMHRAAMDLCDMAMNMHKGGHVVDAIKVHGAALVLEEWVAASASAPARAILYLSAAEIALLAENPARAIELAIEGMEGDGVPSDIREELEDVRYRATLHIKHAALNGEDAS